MEGPAKNRRNNRAGKASILTDELSIVNSTNTNFSALPKLYCLCQFTSGMVKVNSVLPSRLVTLMSSPWLHTMVFTMYSPSPQPSRF